MSQRAQHQVTPEGTIITSAAAGDSWMGRRGKLHDDSDASVVRRRHAHKAWVICEPTLLSRHLARCTAGLATPLYFLDEASALAAGHRPCAECRRSDYNDFRTKWAWTHPGRAPSATEIDADLHSQRLLDAQGQRALLDVPWAFVPVGAFVMLTPGRSAVVLTDSLAAYDETLGRYVRPVERPTSGFATTLTPPSTLAVLQRGYRVQIDPSAGIGPS